MISKYLNNRILVGVVFVLTLAACQKEVDYVDLDGPDAPGSGGSGKPIEGNWNFVGLVGKVSTATSYSDAGITMRGVVEGTYFSKNNAGSVTITQNQLQFTGLAYDIDTTVIMKSYMNGALLTEMEMPLIQTVPASNISADYRHINADSINLDGSALLLPDAGPSPVTPPDEVGARIAWSGDTLLLRMTMRVNQSLTQGGIPATLTGSSQSTLKLVKR